MSARARQLLEQGGEHDAAGREEEAIPYYEEALALGLAEELRPKALLQLGSSLRNVGRHEEAVALLREGAAEYPEHGGLRFFLALALRSAGHEREAFATLAGLALDEADLHGYEPRRALLRRPSRLKAIPVEPSFRAFVARTFGDEGRRWLAELPGVTAELASRWELVLGDELPGGVLASVRAATTAEGRPVVLKIGGPFFSVRNEAAVLRAWDGLSSPALLAADEAVGALLLERISPGTAASDAAAADVAAVLGNLHAVPPPPGLRELGDVARRRVLRALEQARATPYKADWALAKIDELERDPQPQVLLHGDFDERNLLRCSRRGLAAIDPLPCVGDAAYDAGHWAHANRRPGRRARTTAIAEALGLDVARVRGWCAVAAIHG